MTVSNSMARLAGLAGTTLITSFLLSAARPAQAQTTGEEPGQFVTISVGAWTLGTGLDPVGKASFALRIAPRLFAEGTAWARRQPSCSRRADLPGCDEIITQLALGTFFELAGPDASMRPYLGASLGRLNGSTAGNAHLGLRQKLKESVGLRLEAVGQFLPGSGGAYELFGGFSFRL